MLDRFNLFRKLSNASGDPTEGVSSFLPRRELRWRVGLRGPALGRLGRIARRAGLAVEDLTGRVEGAEKSGARLGIEASADHEHALLVGPGVEEAANVAIGVASLILCPRYAPVASHQPLELGGGSGPRKVE